MRYFFEAGSFSELSYAELGSVFEVYNISKDSIKKYSESIFVIESNSVDGVLLDRIFYRLGGFIRYGVLIDNLDTFLEQFSNSSKVVFGISVIGKSDITVKNIQKLANDLKRNFKQVGVSSRFLMPKQLELNAAQILNNDILEKGFELCILNTDKEQIYGQTIGIQDISSFVHRDLDKPANDYDMGMLPHKLARMMCNLAGMNEGIVWDPFCGSGTILMEAAILGLDVIGTDIDHRAIDNSINNIRWLAKEKLIGDIRYNIFPLDIRNIERKKLKDIKRTGVKAVICEPFMGPPQRRVITLSQANTLIEDVKSLYVSLFKALDTIAAEGFRVVLIIPSYKTEKGWVSFSITDLAGKMWSIDSGKDLKWSRNNSIITRNIFVLTRR
jgi:tRNA (guanine10-N2)-dimethyltransferase